MRNIHKFSREFDNVPEIDISIDERFDTENQIIKIKEIAFDEINVIKLPENREQLFSTILEMAVHKIPPFQKGKSDQGFKDALLLLSLINFAKNQEFTLYIIFTNLQRIY